MDCELDRQVDLWEERHVAKFGRIAITLCKVCDGLAS